MVRDGAFFFLLSFSFFACVMKRVRDLPTWQPACVGQRCVGPWKQDIPCCTPRCDEISKEALIVLLALLEKVQFCGSRARSCMQLDSIEKPTSWSASMGAGNGAKCTLSAGRPRRRGSSASPEAGSCTPERRSIRLCAWCSGLMQSSAQNCSVMTTPKLNIRCSRSCRVKSLLAPRTGPDQNSRCNFKEGHVALNVLLAFFSPPLVGPRWPAVSRRGTLRRSCPTA